VDKKNDSGSSEARQGGRKVRERGRIRYDKNDVALFQDSDKRPNNGCGEDQ
jgi:hypothetical protein